MFDSLGSVTNISFTGESGKHEGFPVSFGAVGCRRAGDIALPSFLASMNSVGELVEAILSKVHIAEFNELCRCSGKLEGAMWWCLCTWRTWLPKEMGYP